MSALTHEPGPPDAGCGPSRSAERARGGRGSGLLLAASAVASGSCALAAVLRQGQGRSATCLSGFKPRERSVERVRSLGWSTSGEAYCKRAPARGEWEHSWGHANASGGMVCRAGRVTGCWAPTGRVFRPASSGMVVARAHQTHRARRLAAGEPAACSVWCGRCSLAGVFWR